MIKTNKYNQNQKFKRRESQSPIFLKPKIVLIKCLSNKTL